MEMKDQETHKLFLHASEHIGQTDDSVGKVFARLVKSSVAYRDQIMESKGVMVTDKDIRVVLSWLVPAFSTGELPRTDNKIRLDLLKIWIDALVILP